jgi:pantoate--beta-alanine ligase
MQVIKSPKKLNSILSHQREKGKKIGFVPTMGALHEGHLSLVRRAKRENDVVIVSVFVNPSQFGPREDFRRYPRNLKRDKRLLKVEKIDFLFIPSRVSIYPKGFKHFIDPGPIANYLCGPKRPGHFRGVATVVNRLFEIVTPNTSYFGQKDYQQARIIEEMVQRLKLPIRIKMCPIIREKDRLAMSSRNQYLSKKERTLAPSIYQTLLLAKKLIARRERSSKRLKERLRKNLSHRVRKIDYIEVANPKTCAPVSVICKPVLIALACYLGSTRLIDNLLIKR